MWKKILKVALVAVLAVIFVRAILVLGGYGEEEIASDSVAVVDFSGQITASSDFIKKMEALKNNGRVKGIIVKVNSPGGAVAPSNEIYDYILTVDKPVYAAMGAVAASGGYMVSLAADKIYALPSSITGSIGVVMNLVNMEELFNKIGVKSVVLKSGKFKDVGNPDRPMTEEERAYLMGIVKDMYDQFVDIVVSRRNLDKEEVMKIADGRIFTGRMAKSLGLVDNLGSWREAALDMKTMLNMPGLSIYEVPTEKTWWEKAFGSFSAIYDKFFVRSGFYYMAEIYR